MSTACQNSPQQCDEAGVCACQTVSERGTSYRASWKANRETRKRALFWVVTDDGVATLQHIRTIVTRQRGQSYCLIDTEARLCDLPCFVRDRLRQDGLTPVGRVVA